MQYKQFTLDPFQEEAIRKVEENHSVVVSAATGTGKTLIADYIIEKFLKEGKRVIYTAPIKALSNQKYRDFKKEYGEQNIGIITGDVQINAGAQILIMTTEIYRNMLLARDPLLQDLTYVIFDEIHYFSDIERGTIWEEAIIFSPRFVRFLCLSATIPNAEEFAKWIEEIKEHPVDVVRYAKRAVPLNHLMFDLELGICEPADVREELELEKYPRYEQLRGRRGQQKRERRRPDPSGLIRELHKREWLPCFFFYFSRKQCEQHAQETAKRFDFLHASKKGEVRKYFDTLPDGVRQMESVQRVRMLASRGIAVHHAGLLPQLKEVVELLFSAGLISVLFTTETFAVGINMPAKSVVFGSLRKFDGQNFRMLNSKEYFQLAGRAGRRGIDTVGYAIAMFERHETDFGRYLSISSADTDPIVSQFTLSYNTALHLYAEHDEPEARVILNNSFGTFKKRQENIEARMMASYKHKLKVLRAMGYTDDEGLTPKGKFLRHIYSNELLTGELFGTDLVEDLDDVELCIVVGAIVFEEGRNEYFKMKGADRIVDKLFRKIKRNAYVEKTLNKQTLKRLTLLISRWAQGCEFTELLGITSKDEGDIIHYFRRIMDLLRQIRHATVDPRLADRMTRCIALLDRDVVKVEL